MPEPLGFSSPYIADLESEYDTLLVFKMLQKVRRPIFDVFKSNIAQYLPAQPRIERGRRKSGI